MTDLPDRLAQIGGGTLAFAGALHIAAPSITSWNSDTVQLVPVGVLYVVLGLLVLTSRKGARWIAASCSGLGMIAAVQIVPTAQIPQSFTWFLIALDAVVISALALSLKRTLAARAV